MDSIVTLYADSQFQQEDYVVESVAGALAAEENLSKEQSVKNVSGEIESYKLLTDANHEEETQTYQSCDDDDDSCDEHSPPSKLQRTDTKHNEGSPRSTETNCNVDSERPTSPLFKGFSSFVNFNQQANDSCSVTSDSLVPNIFESLSPSSQVSRHSTSIKTPSPLRPSASSIFCDLCDEPTVSTSSDAADSFTR
jgi:hypothetical protein